MTHILVMLVQQQVTLLDLATYYPLGKFFASRNLESLSSIGLEKLLNTKRLGKLLKNQKINFYFEIKGEL